VAERGGAAAARQRAAVRVDAEEHALRVHVVGNNLEPVGEALLVGDEVAVRVALHLDDAVVEVEVLVAGGDKPAGDHRVDRRAHHRLGGTHLKVVPRVIPHLRRTAEAVVQCKRARGSARREEDAEHGLRLNLL
jgi:hypothetical protein